MTAYILICISVICLAVMYSAIFKRNFAQTAPLAVITIILLAYIPGLLGFLKLGVYSAIILSFICMLFAVFISIGQKDGKTLLFNLVSPGLAVFLIMAVLLYLFVRDNAGSLQPDGYTADMVKNFIAGGNYRSVPSAEGIGYQPGFALFIYMFNIFKKEFSVVEACAGAGIFATAMILPVLGKVSWRNGYLALVFFPLTGAVLFTGGSTLTVFGAVSAEASAALVFSMMLVTYMCCEQCGYVYCTLGLGSALLCIIRPGAEFLVLLMLLVVLLDIAALGFWEVSELFAAPSKWISVVFYVLITVFAFSSWWVFAGRAGLGRLFDSIRMNPERTMGFAGRLGQVFRALFSGKMLIPYVLWIVVFAILAGGAAFLASGFWNRIRTGIQAAIVLLSFVIFLFVLAFAYTYIYPISTNIKATVDMYITAYIMVLLIFAVNLAASKLTDRFFTV